MPRWTLRAISELQVTAKNIRGRPRFGTCVAIKQLMNKICRHCDEAITGKAYRVVSEEDGLLLLNMIVCASCATVAKTLLLRVQEITLEPRTLSLEMTDLSGLLFPYLE